jgi:hypothetical protein
MKLEAFGATTRTIMALSITTFSIVTLGINDTQTLVSLC